MENNNAEKLRIQTLTEFNTSVREFSKSSNQQETEENKLLFNLSTFIIPLSMVAISSDKISNNINFLDKHLIFFSWVSLTISAIFGIIRFRLNSRHYDKWAEQENKRSDCFTRIIPINVPENEAFQMYFDMVRKSNKFNYAPHHTNKPIKYLQYIFSGIGVCLMIGVLTKILFLIN